MNGSAIKTAVVTGAHGFSVVDFHHLFRGLEGVDCYIQHLDDFACATEAERDSYDAVVLYFFVHPYSVGDAGKGEPQDAEEPWFFARKPRAAIEHLGAGWMRSWAWAAVVARRSPRRACARCPSACPR